MTELSYAPYGGWQRAAHLKNGTVDLVITAEVGPRIIRFGYTGERNEFHEAPDDMGQTGGDEWRIYGGHRFWHAPEHPERTYVPDNSPVTIEELDDIIRVTQPTEAATGLQKQLEIQLAPDAAHVTVTHRLINHALWAVQCAPWCLSVMAAGGKAILPLPPRGEHPRDLLPTSTLTLWAYTDMSDPRWMWGKKYVTLQQDATATNPQKLGATVPDGWSAHLRDGYLFVKCFTPVDGVAYPDLNSQVEIFTNTDMLELETLGPTLSIKPGASVTFTENWFLFKDVPAVSDDASIDAAVLPLVQPALEQVT